MPGRDGHDERNERELSLIGHLSELRIRLIYSILSLFACVAVAFFVANPVIGVLTKPITRLERDPGHDTALTIHIKPDGNLKIDKPFDIKTISQRRLDFIVDPAPKTSDTAARFSIGERVNQGVYYSKPLDPFMVPFRVSLVIGILLALPLILHQVWLFIVPGLKPSEKKIVRPMLMAAIILFPIGAFFGYLMVDMLLRTLQAYQPPSLEPLFNIDDYLSLLTNMMIVFGAVFELPLFVALAARMGLVTPAFLTRYRRHAWLLLAVAAMVITPADPFSMIAALIPLVILYEVSVIAARPMARLHRDDKEPTKT